MSCRREPFAAGCRGIMKEYSIYDFEVAEAIYNFVGLPDIFKDFCRKCQDNDLSLAEYVYLFRRNEFTAYCEKKYNFTVYYN